MKKPLRIVVLISGNGSNLQAIIDAIKNNKLNAVILAVISNRAKAYGLERAQHAHIATHVLSSKQYSSNAEYDLALQECIDEYQPDLIVLAGFMRILSAAFVHHYHNKIINIHPSLLPHYTGLDTHARVLAAKEKEHGVSIHFVTEELDGGPVIAQAKLKIDPEDNAATLQDRVHQLEHQLYPQVLQWFAEEKIKWHQDKIYFAEELLEKPLTLEITSHSIN